MKRKSNIPIFKEKIYIICEGIGDKVYLDKVFSFYNNNYDIRVIPSNGKDKLVDKLKEVLILHPYNEYYLFVDTDFLGKETITKYEQQLKLEEISYKNRIYFVNPIIEYLFLINKVDKHPSNFFTKNKYVKLFEKYFNIKDYSGTIKQYEILAKQITKNSFEMYSSKIKSDVSITPISSILELIERIR